MTTAILSALPEEQAGVAALLNNAQTVRHAGRDFVLGEAYGQSMVLALSGIGKVAAATTTAVLIDCFDAQRIIFTGVAGGLGGDAHTGVKVGDAVVGSAYLQHDMDASPLFPRFEVPLYGRARFDADAGLLASLTAAARYVSGGNLNGVPPIKSIKPIKPIKSIKPIKPFTVHQGLIISGDRFVSSSAEAATLKTALPDALCVEMEGAAVAQVCFDYGIPFAAVRTISDRADDTAHLDFPAFVRGVAGPVAVAMIQAWLQARSAAVSN